MVAESWFRGFWKTHRKHHNASESSIGVLAFEVASLMAKLIHLWTSLSDNHVAKLRQDITNSLGIKKLVSDDDDFIVSLICAEMFENLGHVVRAVARLAEKCNDPGLKNFQHVFDDMIKAGADPYGWRFTNRKMDKKAKKMGRFISVNASLYQEMEALSELEHTLRRLKANDEADSVAVVAYEKKAAWKRHEVKQLKEVSLWNKTYDYTVLLLARSLSTIYTRIGHVFGFGHMIDTETREPRISDSDIMYRSQSISTLMQSSVHPAENGLLRFASGPMGNLATRSGPIQLQRTQTPNNFHSGPLGNSNSTVTPNSRTKRTMNNFYSGPLEKSAAKSSPLHRSNKTSLKFWQSRNFSSTIHGKSSHSKSNQLAAAAGPFKGCMMAGGNGSPVKNSVVVSNGVHSEAALDGVSHGGLSIAGLKQRFLNPPLESLGAAALALHYANVIIVIEKLVATPHLIGHDARDDLYNMLPESVRLQLRAKLSPVAKSLTSSDLDSGLAQEWSDAMGEILEWLAPLAHNMIRWQSERSFEHQNNQVSRTNVLLVQTLHFADRHKTEELITELLVGLNYVWRYAREVNAKALLECTSGRALGDNNWDTDGRNIFALDHR